MGPGIGVVSCVDGLLRVSCTLFLASGYYCYFLFDLHLVDSEVFELSDGTGHDQGNKSQDHARVKVACSMRGSL
jgi:hypothetical protein